MIPLINAYYAQDFMTELNELQPLEQALFRQIGIPVDLALTHADEFPMALLNRIFNQALMNMPAHTQHELYARCARLMLDDILPYFPSAPANLREALVMFQRLSEAVMPFAVQRLEWDQGHPWWCRLKEFRLAQEELAADLLFIFFFSNMISLLTGKPWRPGKVKLNATEVYNQMQESPFTGAIQILTGQDRTALRLSEKLLDKPVTVPEEQIGRETLPPAGECLLDSVRYLLEAHLGQADYSVETLAGQMGLSSRGLQKRLKQEDSNFRGLRDQVLLRNARWWLQHTRVPIQDIAYQFGFATTGQFSRTFRRLQQMTPQEFRAGQGL